MERLTVYVSFFQDEDSMWIADCLSIPGCMSQGHTREEAQDNILDAIRECLVVRHQEGMPLTEPVEVERMEIAA